MQSSQSGRIDTGKDDVRAETIDSYESNGDEELRPQVFNLEYVRKELTLPKVEQEDKNQYDYKSPNIHTRLEFNCITPLGFNSSLGTLGECMGFHINL